MGPHGEYYLNLTTKSRKLLLSAIALKCDAPYISAGGRFRRNQRCPLDEAADWEHDLVGEFAQWYRPRHLRSASRCCPTSHGLSRSPFAAMVGDEG